MNEEYEAMLENSDDASSDGSDFVDVSIEDMNLIMSLEKQLEENPAGYDSYVQFIEVLRRNKMKERLREVRRSLQLRFPLTESLWLDWISDELESISTEQDIPKIASLLEQCHEDYLSISLWVQHLQFSLMFDPEVSEKSEVGLATFRLLCEQALAVGGLHMTDGDKIWDVCLNFELEHMNQCTGKSKDEAIEAVRSLFKRRLAIPLQNAESTWQAYQDFERSIDNKIQDEDSEKDEFNTNAFKRVQRSFALAQKAFELRLPFEQALDKAASAGSDPTELLSAYVAYIKVEESSNDPLRVRVMYERAVAAFPVTHFLWLQYARYVETSIKSYAMVESVYSRAVRNCPWVGELWEKLLRLIELRCSGRSQHGNDNDDDQTSRRQQHEATYVAALNSGLQGTEDFILVVLARMDALRRWNVLETLRAVASNAVSMLQQTHPEYMDTELRIPAYWAACEATLKGGSVQKGREVWESILKTTPYNKHPAVVKSFIDFEIHYGEEDNARAIFKRMYARNMLHNGQVEVCNAWLRFERERGAAEDYALAVLKTEPILLKAAAEKAERHAEKQRKKAGAANAKSNLDKEEIKQMRQRNDPTFRKKMAQQQEKQQDEAQYDTAIKKTIVDATIGVDEPIKSSDETREGGEQNQKRKRHAEDGFQGGAHDDNILSDSTAPTKKPRVEQKQAPAADHFATRRLTTAFVKRLPDNADDNALRDLFQPCGPIKLIKIGMDRGTGRHKGFAYVEFETVEGLEAACRLNGVAMGDRNLFIAPSNPPSSITDGGERGRGRGRGRFGGQSSRGRGGASGPVRSHVDLNTDHQLHQSMETHPDNDSSSKHKPGLGFVPRAAAIINTGTAPKTNADFRKMLLDKTKKDP